MCGIRSTTQAGTYGKRHTKNTKKTYNKKLGSRDIHQNFCKRPIRVKRDPQNRLLCVNWDLANRPIHGKEHDVLETCLCSTSCNMLQHAATHYNVLQHTTTYCNTLQHAATHYTTLHHTATYCNVLQHTTPHCIILQHIATYCNTWRGRDMLLL